MMVSERLKGMLSEQIGHELGASQAYLGIAVYFASQDLDKWAEIFYKQSEEERMHALKIVKFLIDVDAQFEIPATSAATTTYGSALEAIEWSLNSERKVTGLFQSMAAAAMEEKDFTAFQFLQWFIEEQVEEESSMQRFVSLLTKEPNPFRAEMIVAELEEHGGEE